MKFQLLPFFFLSTFVDFASASVTELTSDNIDDLTAGKAAFVKFFKSGCAKCDEFAPVWEEFAKDYANDPKYIIAEVDCSADEDFCEGEMDVTEYPSLQYGSHEDILDEYDGSLELEALKEFAAESLALQCSIQFENWCSDEQKELIKRIKAMSSDDLSEKIDEMNDALEVQFSEAEERVEAAEKLMEAATGDDLEKAKRAYEDAERMFDEVIEADQPLELTLMEEYEDMLD